MKLHNQPTLTLFCGLPGSGKTTLAKRFEQTGKGIRICTDDWQEHLGIDHRNEEFHDKLQARLYELALTLLRSGQDVILEDSLWQKTRNEPVPLQIRNSPTQLMKDLDYGKDYKYAHDYYKDMQIEDAERPPTMRLQAYMPESLQARHYYEPGLQGKEASIKQWLEKRRAYEQ